GVNALGSGNITLLGGMGPTSNLIAQLGIASSGITATLSNPMLINPGHTPGANPSAIGFGGLGTDSLEVNSGSTLVLNGAIAGIGPLYKGLVAGTTGTVVFNGTNTYTGGTVINLGTLWAATPASLPGYNDGAGDVDVSGIGTTLMISAGGAGQW